MTRPWPIYNPALLPPEKVGLAHSLRRPLAERLLALLRRIGHSGAPQHQLVLGGPGSGKTMLLRALQSAIGSDPELAQRWLPLTFAEAQWDVARPADFWVNALDYLVIALRRAGSHEQAAALEAQIGALPGDEHARTASALDLLTTGSDALGRRFVLLVDTLDVVLERLKRDEWHVREVLATEPRLLVIGTSARAIEATFRYDAAFYDFFQLHELRPLPRDNLAAALAAVHPDDPLQAVRAFAVAEPALFAALLDLLGTQPRVLALLGLALERATPPHGPELLLAVLDQLTPLMRARIESLAPQVQQVVHALAAAWHPVRPHELAHATRLSANAVSAQLHRLVQEGLADKTALPPSPRHGFLLADRLLQVWLLMRMGQPHRRRLIEAFELITRAHATAGPLAADLFGLADRTSPEGPPAADALQRFAPELRGLVERLATS